MHLYLVKNGVPWDVALALDDTERVAFMVVLGEMEGNATFDWDAGQWIKREK